MTREITMPQLGFTMVEGTVVEWHKRQGEEISKGEVLLEISTEKLSTDVESPVSGVVQEILVPAGATVPVGIPICLVTVDGEEPAHPPLPLGESPVLPLPLGEGRGEGRPPSSITTLPGRLDAGSPSSMTIIAPSSEGGASAPNRIKASGVARRLARERGLSLAGLSGTGPGGRILGVDVQRYLTEMPALPEGVGRGPVPRPSTLDSRNVLTPGGRRPDPALQAHPQSPVSLPRQGRRVPFAGARRIIAERMYQSARETADVTIVAEVDVTEAVLLRGQLLPEWEKAYGVRLTFTDIVVKACGQALREHPAVNATLDGDEILLLDDVDVGIAVALEEGLIVPVLRRADSKPLRIVATESRDLVDRARNRRLSPDEVGGGSFTVTNLGSYGVDFFTPIINPGETAILGVGRVAERPAVYNGDLCKRSMVYLCLVFDHRLVDGAPAALFLKRLRELLERPYLLLT